MAESLMVVAKNNYLSCKPYSTSIIQRLKSTLILVFALTTVVVYSGMNAQIAHAIFFYTEVSEAAGLGPYTMPLGHGGGVASADFDADGDVDFFVPNTLGVPDQLYVNLGDGTFAESAAEYGLNALGNHRVALWFDYNGDHLLDLVVVGDCRSIDAPPCQGSLFLYRQTAENSFVDATATAGELAYQGAGHLGGVSAGDINNDGYLDLFIASWGMNTRFFLNDGDGTFTDITVSSGAVVSEDQTWQPIFYDFDRDGWTDIFVAVDFSDNRLWMNQGDNTFVDFAPEANLIKGPSEMGIAISDYDDDLDMDLYVTNTPANLALHRNDTANGTPAFTDVTAEAGVAEGFWSWGCTFVDGNNDGRVDLAVTNGYLFDDDQVDPSAFFLNLGGEPTTFSTVSDAVGFNDTLWGSCLLALDYDRDGRQDLLQTTRYQAQGERDSTIRLLKNFPDPLAPTKHFIVIKPRQDGPNHWAIGAVVRVQIGTKVLSRLITAGTSFLGQEPAEAHFGLGSATQADSVMIEWPNGDVTQHENILADGVYTVGRSSVVPGPYDFDNDGLTDEEEIGTHGTDPSLPDTDGDGVTDAHEVTFGSDPLNPEETVALHGPSSFRSMALVVFIMISAAIFLRRNLNPL